MTCIHISKVLCNLGAQPHSLAIESSRLPKSLCGLTIIWKSKPPSSISCRDVGEGTCSLSYLWLLIFGAIKPLLLKIQTLAVQKQLYVKLSFEHPPPPEKKKLWNHWAGYSPSTDISSTLVHTYYLTRGSLNKITEGFFLAVYVCVKLKLLKIMQSSTFLEA